MPNPALTQSARQKNVANMLTTLRIEKLSPSESLKPSLQAYVDGQKNDLGFAQRSQGQICRARTRMMSIASQALLFSRTKLG